MNDQKIDAIELKDLVLKLNQDKTMLEKKVERRNAEITRLKSQLIEKDDEMQKKLKMLREEGGDKSEKNKQYD
jgi:hypothetical protein